MTNEWTFLQTKTFGVEWLGVWVCLLLFFRNRLELAVFLSESLQVFVLTFLLTVFTLSIISTNH